MGDLPPTNLQGDYRGSCVVCMRGTDSALAFNGVAEWHIAVLQVLGVPEEQSLLTYQDYLRETGWIGSDTELPDGVDTFVVQVCGDCVAKADVGFPAPLPVALGVPLLQQQ